jgi:cephalosporin hydroxylase
VNFREAGHGRALRDHTWALRLEKLFRKIGPPRASFTSRGQGNDLCPKWHPALAGERARVSWLGSGRCSTAETVLEHLYSDATIVGKSGKAFDSRPALSTVRNLEEIERLLRESQPENTLEIGMAFGGSALVFAGIGRAVGPNAYRHMAIDPFQSTVWDSVGLQCIEMAGLANYVEVVQEPSCLVLPRLLGEGRQFGLIYVDGSHLFEDVFVDAYFSARLLGDHGYLLFDDSSNGHVAKVLAFIDKSVPTLERVPERGLRQRIAHLLGRRQLTIYRRIGPIDRPWSTQFHNF